jgi:UDP-N-acetylmuramate dehydrogenase
MSADLDRQLHAAFGASRVRRSAALAPLTTFKVGGPADWLIEVRSGEDVIRALALARAHDTPVTILGGGSNVLVADAGLRGVVIRIHGGDAAKLDATHVRADAGMTINGLVRWTIGHGVAGLEAWAGTRNRRRRDPWHAHFRGRLIGELVEKVTLASRDGVLVEVPATEMEFGYDQSRLHRTREVVINAVFRVSAESRMRCEPWPGSRLPFANERNLSNRRAPGAFSQNPQPSRDAVPPGIPASAGALVDRAGLKNARSGGARVSTTHANFIVTEGTATAADIRELIARCKRDVHARFGVQLREEIVARVRRRRDSTRLGDTHGQAQN